MVVTKTNFFFSKVEYSGNKIQTDVLCAIK